MTPVTRPRGPLPARVYWVRRALVLATAFLLVFGFARMLGGGSDAESDPEGTAVGVSGETSQGASPTDGSSSGGPTEGDESADESTGPNRKKNRPKATRTPLARPDGPCDPSDLTIEADLRRTQADDAVEIPLQVSGTEEACSWTFSRKTTALNITSGSDMIWSSQECGRLLPEEDVVVRSEKPARVVFEWNGRRSDEECSRQTQWALPGAYHVVVAPFGGEPTDVQFMLSKPKPDKIYKPRKNRPRANKPGANRPGANRPGANRPGADEPSAPQTRPVTEPTHEPSGAVLPGD